MKNKRNLGIDCLRIVCMLMVVILYVLAPGGTYKTKQTIFWNL